MNNIKKCVIIGDGFVGKTFLVKKMNQQDINEYTESKPTILDHITIVRKPFQINFADTSGQEQYEAIRATEYKEANLFVVCFSIDNLTTFRNVNDIWLPDIKKSKNSSPIILVGTKSDLRNDPETLATLQKNNKRFISEREAIGYAKEENMIYIECSSLKEKNVKQILDRAFEMCFNDEKSKGNCIARVLFGCC